MRRFDTNVRTVNKAWLIVLAEHLKIDTRNPAELFRVAMSRIEENIGELTRDPNNLDAGGNFSFKKAKENLFEKSSDAELQELLGSLNRFGASINNRAQVSQVRQSAKRGDKNVRTVNKAWLLIMAEHLNITSISQWRSIAMQRVNENIEEMAQDERNVDANGNFCINQAKRNLFTAKTEKEREELSKHIEGFGAAITRNLNKNTIAK